MAASLFGLAVVLACAIFPTLAAAQGSDTVYDESGALSGPEEQRVQQAFDSAQEETGQPLYAFLVPNKGGESQTARQELLTREGNEAQVPDDAGVVVVATKDSWGATYNFPQDAYDAMVPDFRDGDFAEGLVTGAREIQGEPAPQDAQNSPDPLPGGLWGGGLLLLVAVAGGVLLWRNRRANRRRIEEERRRRVRQPHRSPGRVRREGAARLGLSGGPTSAVGPAHRGMGGDEDLGRQDYRVRRGVR